MTKLTRLAVEELGLSQKEADRCRNFFAMGLVFWLYDRPLDPTLRYIDEKFGKTPRHRRGQSPGPDGRLQLRRNDRGLRRPLRRRQGEAAAGQISQHHGQSGAGLGLDGRRRAQRLRAVPRLVSDHAGQRHSARADPLQEFRRPHVSGRRRNRRHDLGHRRRRSAERWP